MKNELTDEQLRDALRQCPHDTVENLRVRWLYAKDFARAVIAAHEALQTDKDAEIVAVRQPLTDEQTDDLIKAHTGGFIGGMHFVRLARAVEQAHGIGKEQA